MQMKIMVLKEVNSGKKFKSTCENGGRTRCCEDPVGQGLVPLLGGNTRDAVWGILEINAWPRPGSN